MAMETSAWPPLGPSFSSSSGQSGSLPQVSFMRAEMCTPAFLAATAARTRMARWPIGDSSRCTRSPTSFMRSGVAPRPVAAGRAGALLRSLLAEGEPHPVGSAGDARIRERLLRVLRQLGYETTVQDAFSCRDASCARVQNVIARLPGGGGGAA